MASKKKLDFIMSLGGNCAAAHNLRYRNMRLFSLPLDWCYSLDNKPIWKLSELFRCDFENFAKKENLKLLPIKESKNNAHQDKIQYYDVYTGYRFVNHFEKSIEEGSYPFFAKKMEKRIKRLYRLIKKSNNVLFIYSADFKIDLEAFQTLSKTLSDMYPDKNFEFELLQFNSKIESSTTDEINYYENITLRKFKRKYNLYDYLKTNYEWSFLDDIEINKKIISDEGPSIIKIQKLKRGILINLFPKISTFFNFKCYFFGLRVALYIGKVRE